MTVSLPIHLHAENYSTIEGMPQDVIAPLVQRLESLRLSFDSVAEARSDIMADTSMTEDGRLLALDDLYASRLSKSTEEVRAAALAVTFTPNLAAFKRNEVLKPSKDAVELGLASEIRTRLAALPETARRIEVERAAKTGDRRMMSAIANAPAFLTGIEQADVEAYRDEFIALHHADIDVLKRAADEAAGRGKRALQELANLRAIIFSADEERRLLKIKSRRASAKRHLS